MATINRKLDRARLSENSKHLKTYATEANAFAAVEKYAPQLEGAILSVLTTTVWTGHAQGDRVIPILIYQPRDATDEARWGATQSCILASQAGFTAFA